MLVTVLSACGLGYDAMAPKGSEPSDELKYLYKTDQKDRKRVLIKLISKKYEKAIQHPKVISVSSRDSLRLERVMNLHRQGKIKTDEDKFYAASIYDHGGGFNVEPDSAYFRTAYTMFKELYDKDFKKGLTKSLMNTAYERWQESIGAKKEE